MKKGFSIKHFKWIVGLIFFVIIVKFVYDYMTDESSETFNNFEPNKCYIKFNDQATKNNCTTTYGRHGNWFKDPNINSHKNATNCNNRKQAYENWCGVKNVEVNYEPNFQPNKCYIKLNELPKNSGCKNWLNRNKHIPDQYFMDGGHRNSHANATNCNKRINDWNRWCGVNNVETKYELEPNKCYIKYNDKPKQSRCGTGYGSWFKDGYTGGWENVVQCNRRIQDYKDWCGVNDVEVKHTTQHIGYGYILKSDVKSLTRNRLQLKNMSAVAAFLSGTPRKIYKNPSNQGWFRLLEFNDLDIIFKDLGGGGRNYYKVALTQSNIIKGINKKLDTMNVINLLDNKKPFTINYVMNKQGPGVNGKFNHYIDNTSTKYYGLPTLIFDSNYKYDHSITFKNISYRFRDTNLHDHGTNVHFHNLQTDAYSDGSNMEQVLNAGDNKVFRPSLNINETGVEKTIIYHTHAHGLSAKIAESGCYGIGILVPKNSETGFKPEYLSIWDHPIVMSGGLESHPHLILNFKPLILNKEIKSPQGIEQNVSAGIHRFRIACAYTSFQDYSVIHLMKGVKDDSGNVIAYRTDTTVMFIADEDGLLTFPNIFSKNNKQIAISSGNRYEILADLEPNSEYIIRLIPLPRDMKTSRINWDVNMLLSSVILDPNEKRKPYGITLFKINVGNKSYMNPYKHYYDKKMNPPKEGELSIYKYNRDRLQNGLVNWNTFDPNRATNTNYILYPNNMDMLWNITDDDFKNNKYFRIKNFGHDHHNTHEFSIQCGLNRFYKTYGNLHITLTEGYFTVSEFVKMINDKLDEAKKNNYNTWGDKVGAVQVLTHVRFNIIRIKYSDINARYLNKIDKIYGLNSVDKEALKNITVLSPIWYFPNGVPTGHQGYGYLSPNHFDFKINCNKYMGKLLGKHEINIYRDRDPPRHQAIWLSEEDKKKLWEPGSKEKWEVHTTLPPQTIGTIFNHGFVNKTYFVDIYQTEFVKWKIVNLSGMPHNFHHHLFQAKIDAMESSPIFQNELDMSVGNYLANPFVGVFDPDGVKFYKDDNFIKRTFTGGMGLIKYQIGKDTWILPDNTYMTLYCPIVNIPVTSKTVKANNLKPYAYMAWDVPYMVHCHFLPHEDMGMMSTFRVEEKILKGICCSQPLIIDN